MPTEPIDLERNTVRIYTSGDWSALYLNGVLVTKTVGDSYLAREHAMALAGIDEIYDDDFMRGQDKRDGVAKTEDEIHIYKMDREEKEAKAAELREQAAALLRQADEIDPEVTT